MQRVVHASYSGDRSLQLGTGKQVTGNANADETMNADLRTGQRMSHRMIEHESSQLPQIDRRTMGPGFFLCDEPRAKREDAEVED